MDMLSPYDRMAIPENLPGHLRQLGGVSLFSRHNGRWLATRWSLHDSRRPPARPCQRHAGSRKPPKATAKPYSRHILGIYSRVQSHPKATPRPHQSHTKATPKPPQSHPKARRKPGDWEVHSYSLRILFVFSWCFHRIL